MKIKLFKNIQKRFDKAIMAVGPHRYQIDDHKITCLQCSHNFFDEGEAQLNPLG